MKYPCWCCSPISPFWQKWLMVYIFLFLFCLIICYLYYNHHYLLKIRKLKLTKYKWLLKLSQLVSGRVGMKTQVISIFAPSFYCAFFIPLSIIISNSSFIIMLSASFYFFLLYLFIAAWWFLLTAQKQLGAKLPRFLRLALYLLRLLTFWANFLSLLFLFTEWV